MTLAKELITQVYASMPSAMAINSAFARALVDAALERAAQECDTQRGLAKANGWIEAQRMAHNLGVIIRALMDEQRSEEQP